MKARVIPNAKVFSASFENGVLKIRVRSPPAGGKANEELEKGLSKLLGVKVLITKGLKSRNKEVAVSGLSEEEVAQRVNSPASQFK